MNSERDTHNPDESLNDPYLSETDSSIPVARPIARTNIPPVHSGRAIEYELPAKPEHTSFHGSDVLIGVACIWCGEVMLSMILGFILVLIKAPSISEMEQVSSPEFLIAQMPSWLVFGSSIVSNLWTLAVCWYFVCQKYGKSFANGFALRSVSVWTLLFSVFLGLLGVFAAGILLSNVEEMGDSPLAKMISTREDLLMFSLFAVVIPPFEEIYYRGFLYPVIRDKIGPMFGILVISLWFTAVHSIQLAGDWEALIPILIMGTSWTILREATKSLVPSIVCHLTYNAGIVVISLLESS
ncbi:MAG: CPBP family intramembrane metalloprotease [Phycisphaerales bacterium]|nr:CPBP family intramembrane metalloprotease [Phycisphaerales bacterium]